MRIYCDGYAASIEGVGVHSRLTSGVDYNRSKIVFATAGLAARWYASQGISMWQYYDGVMFDEINHMALDPEYASLWESARLEAEQRDFLVSWMAGILKAINLHCFIQYHRLQSAAFGGVANTFS